MKSERERQETRQYRELRKENIRLKRQIAEMRREMRLIEREESEDVLEIQVLAHSETSHPCPKCGSLSTSSFTVMARDYYRCESCGSKGRKAIP